MVIMEPKLNKIPIDMIFHPRLKRYIGVKISVAMRIEVIE